MTAAAFAIAAVLVILPAGCIPRSKTVLAHKLTTRGRPKNSASCAGEHMRAIDVAHA
jgi:hypothetical protein